MAADKKTLQDIEKLILKMLSESTEEQILDEDTLINTLEESNVTSTEINKRIADAAVVEVSINETRASYTTVAVRGSIIYFVIADMSRINDMYQNSLQFVKVLFNKAIDASEKSDDHEGRLANLIDTITKMIFSNVSRGLFGKDKLIFSLLICTSIDRNRGKINQNSWNLLLRGTQMISDKDKKAQPVSNLPETLFTPLAQDFLWSAEKTEEDIYGGLFESF